MGRPRKEAPIVPTGPKCYPVTVPNADEQRAFEAMAAHQNRPDVGTWLRDLARVYVRKYFSHPTPSNEGADA
jgi:hypothetical protein